MPERGVPGAARVSAAIRNARRRVHQRKLAGPRLLRSFAREHHDVFFAEIGSNDGVQQDFLRPLILRHSWSGIMVEPVPFVFERLRANYADVPSVTCVNVAVTRDDGELPFFHLAEVSPSERQALPEWYDALGSFSRDAVLTHATHIPDIEARLVETTVPCMSFDSLVRAQGIERVDLVLIDTEGHDAEIVRTIDLTRYRPRLLVYEHYHLDADTRENCRQLVHSHGYEVIEEGFDTWCVDTGPDDGLARLARRAVAGTPAVSVYDDPARTTGEPG
jgi:FkbM family methyltransferase